MELTRITEENIEYFIPLLPEMKQQKHVKEEAR